MTQGFAKHITLSLLTFSLLASVHAFAQQEKTVEIEALPPATEVDESSSSESSEASSEAVKASDSKLVTKPVSVTPSMAPAVVPAAQPSASTSGVQVPSQLQSNSGAQGTLGSTPITVSAPRTGVGGDNPGNANTGGVQVQNITVQASPTVTSDQNQSALQGTDSRAEALRRERLRNEILNESRLMERLEEGRLQDEGERKKSVEMFDSSMAKAAADAQATASMSVAPVAPIGASVEPVSASASATVIAAPAVEKPSEAKIKISPFGGHRWFAANNPSNQNFNVQNQFLVGAQVTGQINRFIGIEGRFTYGRDALNPQQGLSYYGAGGYGPSYYSGYTYGANPYGYGQGYGYGYYSPQYNLVVPVKTRDSFQFDANARIGMKFGIVNPYGLAGVGFLFQKYNIDDQFTTDLATISGWERSTNHLVGNFGAGVDVDLGSMFAVGARFEYNHIFNKSTSYMNELYGDSYNRLSLTGSVSVQF